MAKQSKYITGAQEVLREVLAKKSSEFKDNIEYFKGLDNVELIEASKTSSLNSVYLTPKEVESALANTEFSNYYDMMENFRDQHISFVSEGETEITTSVRDENFGLRNAFQRY